MSSGIAIAIIILVVFTWVLVSFARTWDARAGLIAALVFVSSILATVMYTPLVEIANRDSPVAVVVLVSIIMMASLAAIGVAWTPFAMAFSYIFAKARGMSGGEHAIRGGLYSFLLLLPWLYLSVRMMGISLPRAVIATAYVVVYTFWMILILGCYLRYVLTESIPYHSSDSGGIRLGLDTFFWLAVTAISFFAWVFTLLRLWRVNRGVRRDLERPAWSTSLDKTYLHPFGQLLLWLIGFPVVWLITVPMATIPMSL